MLSGRFSKNLHQEDCRGKFNIWQKLSRAEAATMVFTVKTESADTSKVSDIFWFGASLPMTEMTTLYSSASSSHPVKGHAKNLALDSVSPATLVSSEWNKNQEFANEASPKPPKPNHFRARSWRLRKQAGLKRTFTTTWSQRILA